MLKLRALMMGTILAGLLSTGLAVGAPAAMASGSGSCVGGDGSTGKGGDGCLYYHPGEVGGYYGNAYAVNFQGKTFGGCNNGSCAGDGQAVRNNAGSVANWDYACTLTVWVYPLGTSGNTGQSFAPWTAGDLNTKLHNNEASQTWSGPGSC